MIIILRKKNKIFSQTSEIPDQFPIPEEWLSYPIEVVVDKTKRYDNEFSQFTKEERKLIKAYQDDLENNYIYKDNPERPQGQTEYLSEFSKPYKKNRPFHRLTKRINISDRFDYLVYPPELEEQEDGSFKVIIPIVIQSLKDHNIAGQKKYSDKQQGRQKFGTVI